MANPVIRLRRAISTTPVLFKGEVAVNTSLNQLYIGLGDNDGEGTSTAKFVLKPQAVKVIFSDAPAAQGAVDLGYIATIQPKETFTGGNKTFLLPNQDGTILTTGNIGSVITNAILNAISNAVAEVTSTTPFIKNLSLNTNGELVAVYSNNTTSVIGDVVELDQPLDGGTF